MENIGNYSGTVSQKEYWFACILNVPAMFVFIVPFALILRNFSISPEVGSALFLIAFHVPALALYFRRANDVAWKPLTALFMAIVMPIVSGLIVGALPSVSKGTVWPRAFLYGANCLR